MLSTETSRPPVVIRSQLPVDIRDRVSRIFKAFWANKSIDTLRGYRSDLEDFTRSLGCTSLDAMATRFFTLSHFEAVECVLEYQAFLRGEFAKYFDNSSVEAGEEREEYVDLTYLRIRKGDPYLKRKLAPRSVRRRISAIVSLTRSGYAIGLVDWPLVLPKPGKRLLSIRDTKGPEGEVIKRMFRLARGRGDTKGIRDYVILRLLAVCALRRNEVATLDLEHFDRSTRKLFVLGKGQEERISLTIPEKTADALIHWIETRGSHAGPLFTSLDKAHPGQRLSGWGIYHIVTELGKEINTRVTPHGLRHAAITKALDLVEGNVRIARIFARHQSVETTLIYDDARRDEYKRTSELIDFDDYKEEE